MNDMKLSRREKDHLRYMADRERRLTMQREWDKAHPNYHRDYYRRRVSEEIDKERYLKSLAERIWNLQKRT